MIHWIVCFLGAIPMWCWRCRLTPVTVVVITDLVMVLTGLLGYWSQQDSADFAPVDWMSLMLASFRYHHRGGLFREKRFCL